MVLRSARVQPRGAQTGEKVGGGDAEDSARIATAGGAPATAPARAWAIPSKRRGVLSWLCRSRCARAWCARAVQPARSGWRRGEGCSPAGPKSEIQRTLIRMSNPVETTLAILCPTATADPRNSAGAEPLEWNSLGGSHAFSSSCLAQSRKHAGVARTPQTVRTRIPPAQTRNNGSAVLHPSVLPLPLGLTPAHHTLAPPPPPLVLPPLCLASHTPTA